MTATDPNWLTRQRAGFAENRTVFTITAGNTVAGLAMSFWTPFLPLYLLDLGATSEADALFWVTMGWMGQGISRIVSGPVWGVLADRLGRKVMFVRALFFAGLTTLIAGLMTEPWHFVIAFSAQGLLSGFNPAAVALTSVIVPDSRLSKSIGWVSSGSHLSSTLGPAMGALLAVSLGFRGAILVAAALPAIASVFALVTIPNDIVRRPAKRL